MTNDVNSPGKWESGYERGTDGWDLGGPTPVFKRLASNDRFKPGRMMVLGAGGPPFAVSVSEIFALFGARRFTLLQRETPVDSVPQRRGLEQLLIFQAPSKLSRRRREEWKP